MSGTSDAAILLDRGRITDARRGHADPGGLGPALPAAALRLAGRGVVPGGRRGHRRRPGRRGQPRPARRADRRADQLPGLLAERTTVFAASGNHDLDGPGDARRAGRGLAAAARGTDSRCTSTASSVDIGDTRFTVCPWWDGPVTRDEVGAPAGRGRGGPAGAVGLALPRASGRHAAVPRRAAHLPRPRPRRLDRRAPAPTSCCAATSTRRPWADGGSWHARLGRTWVFNAGKQIGKVPPHITLDTDAGTADWFGVFESETLSLA